MKKIIMNINEIDNGYVFIYNNTLYIKAKGINFSVINLHNGKKENIDDVNVILMQVYNDFMPDDETEIKFFNNADIGSYFMFVDEDADEDIYIKTEEFKINNKVYNTVNVVTGKFEFIDNEDIYIIENDLECYEAEEY